VSLSLCRLGLAAVPEAVFALTKLQVLDVSHNQIETLPDGIGLSLKALRQLHASSNRLAALPSSLAELSQLFVLALQSNRLGGVPAVAMRCKRLRELKCGAQQRPALSASAASGRLAPDPLVPAPLAPGLQKHHP